MISRFSKYTIGGVSSIGLALPILCDALAQTNSVLASAAIPKAHVEAFESLLDEKFTNPALSRDLLCRKYPNELTSRPDEFKSAFIKSEVDLTASIVFSSKKAPADSFAFDVHFLKNGLQLKHGRAKRSVDYNGLRVPPSKDWLRYILYRGAGGTDMVVISPALQDCSTRGVVLCPRSLSMGGITKPNDYAPNSISVTGHVEAEGIFAVDAGQSATTTIEIKATEGIPLPIRTTQSTTATSAIETMKFDFPEAGQDPPLLPLPSLPSVSVLEAFVRFARNKTDAFEYSSRSDITISPFEIKAQRKINVDEGQMYLSAGQCFILMKRLETGGRRYDLESDPNQPAENDEIK